MNMFARFDENPAMTLQDIKKTKRYGRTDACTHGQREYIYSEEANNSVHNTGQYIIKN